MNNAMNTETSTSLAPRRALAAGVALCLLSIGLVCAFVMGLKTNKTMGFSKHQSGIVLRQDNPVEFWLSESGFLIFAILLGSRGAKFLRTAYRQTRD